MNVLLQEKLSGLEVSEGNFLPSRTMTPEMFQQVSFALAQQLQSVDTIMQQPHCTGATYPVTAQDQLYTVVAMPSVAMETAECEYQGHHLQEQTEGSQNLVTDDVFSSQGGTELVSYEDVSMSMGENEEPMYFMHSEQAGQLDGMTFVTYDSETSDASAIEQMLTNEQAHLVNNSIYHTNHNMGNNSVVTASVNNVTVQSIPVSVDGSASVYQSPGDTSVVNAVYASVEPMYKGNYYPVIFTSGNDDGQAEPESMDTMVTHLDDGSI